MNAGARLALALVLLTGTAWPTAAQQVSAENTPTQTPLRLDTLERDTLARHPDVMRAAAAIDAARGRARQAGMLPNPMVGVEGDDLRTDEAKYGVFAEQEIPLGGQLGAARRAMLAEVERLEAERERVLGGIRADLRTAWYRALAAQQRVEVLDTLGRLSVEAVEITEQLYNTGVADRPDVLEAEVEAGRARLALAAARNQLVAAARRLAAVAGDPAVEGLVATGTLDAQVPDLPRDATIQRILTASPRVLVARAAVRAAEARVSQARRLMAPELVLRGGAARERGHNHLGQEGWIASFEAGVTLPLFNRNQGGTAAALAEQRMAEADLARLQLDLNAEAHQSFADYLTALRATEEYRTNLLTRAEEAYRLYLARYREMAAAYPQVLIAQRSLMQLTEEYLMQAEQLWTSVVRLETMLSGAPAGGGSMTAVRAGAGGGGH
jgi:cobalt-zinc-cadmium efflux system outer membrane protein